VAALPFTSGTTGRPRAVELTHRNLLGNVRQVAGVVPPTLGPDDVSVGVLPFSHSYGLTVGLNHALHAGATLVTLPRFEPAAFLDALATHRVTVARVVPPLVGLLADHPAVADRDLDALETVLSGAATLDPAVADACADRLDCRVVQGYGLTEASPVTHYTPHDDVRRGRVGPPVPNTACRVVDPDDGTPLDAGEVGAVEVRGPQVARGYHGADAPPLAPDGWLSTGDLGRLDADGFLRVCGRTGDAVAYKGHTVAPAEPEAVLRRHPSVADAAVVAAPDDEAGEVPVARVVPAPDADLDPDALLAFAAERLSAPRRPRAVTAVDTLPRTDAGKLRRAAVRDRARDRDEDRPSDR
jgi:acyl-CoA synthetase (AMP-forming)/AMP-acid ligase II